MDKTCEVNPEDKPNMRIDHRNKVLYVCILRYIYGIIKSALHWYELYIMTFKYVNAKKRQ